MDSTEFFPYPAQYEQRVTLASGQLVLFRPIHPEDGPLILDLFSRLSRESIFYRFLTHLKRLQPARLRHLVRIDYRSHFCLAAVILEEGREAMIGTSRFMVAAARPDRAELTVTVRDDWQGRGIGKMLASRVVEIARSRGIAAVEILIDPRNERMIHLFSRLGYPARYESSLLDVCDRMEIDLTGEKSASESGADISETFRL